jgi:hypothetical protein
MSFRILYSIISFFFFKIERLYLRVLSGNLVILISSCLDLGVERAFLISCKAKSFAGHINPVNYLIERYKNLFVAAIEFKVINKKS